MPFPFLTMCGHVICLPTPVWGWLTGLGRAGGKPLRCDARKAQTLTIRCHCLCPRAVPWRRSTRPRWGFGLCHEPSWSWWSLGKESQSTAALQVRGSLRTRGAVRVAPQGSPLLASHPAKAPHTWNTCVEDPREDPALAVSDGPEARSLPLLKDLHAAVPVSWVQATRVVTAPVPRNHTAVIVAIDLGRKKTPKESAWRGTCRVRGQARELRKEVREPLSSGFSVSSWVIWVIIVLLILRAIKQFMHLKVLSLSGHVWFSLTCVSFPPLTGKTEAPACQWRERDRKPPADNFWPELTGCCQRLAWGVQVWISPGRLKGSC